MVHFRIWPTAAAGVAMLATTAIALAGPTPTDTGSIRPAPPVNRPVTLVRHPVATTAASRSTVVPSVNQDTDDNRLLGRINQIDRENCALAMRERPTFDASILAGIIDQRRAECMRRRFNGPSFNSRSRDADDHRFVSNRRPFDADDHRFVDNGRQFGSDDRRIRAARIDDRRDDRQLSRLRAVDRRDDRQISRIRNDRDDRRPAAMRFATAARVNRPMTRPRPRP
jgi:hypothetical protein